MRSFLVLINDGKSNMVDNSKDSFRYDLSTWYSIMEYSVYSIMILLLSCNKMKFTVLNLYFTAIYDSPQIRLILTNDLFHSGISCWNQLGFLPQR
jgi:hypothetical protein